MSTKNNPQSVGAQGVCKMVKYGVYQFVYHGHFFSPEALLPGCFCGFFAFYLLYQGSHTLLAGLGCLDFSGVRLIATGFDRLFLTKILKEEIA